MSDYYGNKEFKRKTEFSTNRDFHRGRGGYSRIDKDAYSKKPIVEKAAQPTILLKARDADRASSPASSAISSFPKKDEASTSYQIQGKTTAIESAAPSPMAGPVPLLNGDLSSLEDNCLKYLSDQSDFLVVGCLGCPGVGKSTLLSLLANPQLDHTQTRKFVFESENRESQTDGKHMTRGIDIFVTSNRIILLDCQPTLLSNHPTSSYGSEINGEMQSVKLASFLFSVCHVVLFVQDYFLDPDLLRFLQTAEMLKPSTSTTIGETIVEYFPHLVFIHNKAEDWEFEAAQIKLMQETYLKVFSHSRLQIQTGFGIANGDVSPLLDSTTCGQLVNVFPLPKFSSDVEVYTGHPTFKNLFRKFRNQVLSTPRTPISHTLLTEKKWFQYASKVLEGVEKSSFFNEYNRLISSI